MFRMLGHRTSCFSSWDTGRHVLRVETPELDFGSKEMMRPKVNHALWQRYYASKSENTSQFFEVKHTVG